MNDKVIHSVPRWTENKILNSDHVPMGGRQGPADVHFDIYQHRNRLQTAVVATLNFMNRRCPLILVGLNSHDYYPHALMDLATKILRDYGNLETNFGWVDTDDISVSIIIGQGGQTHHSTLQDSLTEEYRLGYIADLDISNVVHTLESQLEEEYSWLLVTLHDWMS